jgi:hypothetical protein
MLAQAGGGSGEWPTHELKGFQKILEQAMALKFALL